MTGADDHGFAFIAGWALCSTLAALALLIRLHLERARRELAEDRAARAEGALRARKAAR